MPGNSGKSKVSSAHRKDHRKACRAHGEARKQARIRVQHDREAANRVLVKAGELTPWQQARAARAAGRAGLREIWLASRKGEQLPAS